MTYPEATEFLDTMQGLIWYELVWPDFTPVNRDINPINYWAIFEDGHILQSTG